MIWLSWLWLTPERAMQKPPAITTHRRQPGLKITAIGFRPIGAKSFRASWTKPAPRYLDKDYLPPRLALPVGVFRYPFLRRPGDRPQQSICLRVPIRLDAGF